MENCYDQGKLICTFVLKDDNGLYYEDLVLAWKEAASEHRLTCVECGAPVYLAAGPIKEPYFAHYTIDNCDYGGGTESEELKKGKRLLYQLLKRSLPECEIQARYRMENGMYCTLYCRTKEGRELAFDYRLVNNSLEKYRMRDNFYQAHHIKPIYILGSRQDKEIHQIDWYQSLLQSSMGYLVFLDTEKETLTLKKSFSYRLGKDRKFKLYSKTYPIKDLCINSSGQMHCDFTIQCSRVDDEIQEEKLRYQRSRDKQKEIRELREKLEEQDRIRMEAYRISVKQDRRNQESYRVSIEQDKRNQEAYRASVKQDSRNQEVYRASVKQDRIDQEHYRYSGSQHAKPLGKAAEGSTEGLLSEQQDTGMGLNAKLLDKCRKMIAEGNAHLVSKKYYDAIMGEQQ